MKVLLHVNYYEGAGKLDTLFDLAKINGCDGVELRQIYRFPDMDQRQYQEEVERLKQKYPEMEIVFGCTVDFTGGTEEEVKKQSDALFDFMDWASCRCGTPVMNMFTGPMIRKDVDYTEFHLNGSGMATEEHYQKAAKGLRMVGDKAASLKMLMALETHNGYLHDLARPCKKLMEMTAHESIGINYDHGNIILSNNGESIADVFSLLEGKIYYAHLKNLLKFKNSYQVTHLDAGYIDTMEVVAGLKNNLKSDMVAIEYPCPGDGIIAAKRDMEYMHFIKNWLKIS